ncbi:MAG: hypothetical protein BGO55_04285 [Sphingobacteriales bacterium 50-39]|nr:hypothetical protein [Sphingobacteriales bacterium]OJW55850.1 MAG: hypothetical protein BGO55_04285 [Sphingobacteriales bacterium 50-39]
MLYQLFFYVLISCVCLWSGMIFYSFFINSEQADSSYQRPLASYFFSGLIMLAALGQWFVLFLPLNAYILWFFILPPLSILSILFRRRLARIIATIRSQGPASSFLFPILAAFVVMVLVLNSGPTVMDDTDSYHIQMVKWAQEHGTVPGVANLHLRYGFNSSWFLAIALLIPPSPGINHYMTLNGLISIWLCYYLLCKVTTAFSSGPVARNYNSAIGAFIVLILGLAVWPMIRGNATTANYDFISTCIIIILFMEAGVTRKPALMPEWIVWPLFLCTIKLVNIVMLACCLQSLLIYFSRRSLRLYIAAAFFILIPFFLRNLILSGYILYPLYQLDFFYFDWKVPRQLVVEIMDYVEYFNRSNGNQELVIHRPFPDWVPIWHTQLVLYDKVLTDLSVLCWALVLLRWKKLTATFSSQYRILLLTLLLMLAVWFFVAPDPRFIYGVLLAGVYTLIMTLPPLLSQWGPRRILGVGTISLSCCILVYTIVKIASHQDYRNWTLPHPLPVPAVQLVTVDGIEMQIPERALGNWNPRCYDLSLPCLYTVSPFLHARGKHISDGFKMVTGQAKKPIRGEFNNYQTHY